MPPKATSAMALLPNNDHQETSPTESIPYQSSTAETVFSWLMIALPFIAPVIFPFLLGVARSYPSGSSDQITVLTALFASNRIYLYIMSTTIVGLVALRSAANDSPSLGQRIVDVTEELLYSPPLTGSGNKRRRTSTSTQQDDQRKEQEDPQSTTTYQKSAMIQNLSDEVGDSLDGVSSETQAIVLPALVVALFTTSFAFVKLLNVADGNTVDAVDNEELANVLRTYGPVLSSLWNGLIITLFTRCEIRRLLLANNVAVGSNDGKPAVDTWLPWVLGAAITALAFGGVWEAQNVVNMSLAILVARAIQINNLPAILGALSLLTLYDATTVLFLPANAADLVSDVSNQVVAAASAASSPDTLEQAGQSSAMGSVAINKLTASNFQPGLLVTKLEGRIGGALGLGDAVFPSLLATMARRFDVEQNHSSSLFLASMVGYAAGCAACEVVPFISSTGVPALLFIVPFMVASTLVAALLQGNLQSFWEFDPEALDGPLS